MLKTSRNCFIVVFYSACLSSSLAAAQPLFDSDEPLSVVLELPTKEMAVGGNIASANSQIRARTFAIIEQAIQLSRTG